jgi:hypothetical protein
MILTTTIMLTTPLIFELGFMSEPKKKQASIYPKSGQISNTFNGGKV